MIDISDPANPVIRGVTNIPIFTVAGVAVARSYAFVSDAASFFVIDILDPTNPAILGAVEADDEIPVFAWGASA